MHSIKSSAKSGFPGLLPWQLALIFYMLGSLFLVHKAASLTAASIVLIFRKRLSPAGFSIWLGGLAFSLGWFMVFMNLPQFPEKVPEWILKRQKAWITAQVDNVRGKPENRLEITLSHVRYQIPAGQKGFLQGNLVCKWEDPASVPCPGQKLKGNFRIKPIKGFKNFHSFDSRFYWRLKNIRYRTYAKGLKNKIVISGPVSSWHKLRLKLRKTIIRHTKPGEGRAFLLALLMADRSLLDYSTLDMVRKASLAHSLAQSGLHVGFLIGIAYFFVRILGYFLPKIHLYLPRVKLTFFFSLPLVLFYLWLGQAKESLLRASLMFFFWGLLSLRGKKNFLLDGLFFALAAMLLVSPLTVYKLGLQLSITAVAGIILFWPALKRTTESIVSIIPEKRSQKFASNLLNLLGISLVANIALLPLLAYDFGRISPHIYLNLLWIPALGMIVMPFGLVGLAFCFLPGLKTLGVLGLQAASHVLYGMSFLLKTLEENGLLENIVTLRPSWPEVIGYWLLLLFLASILQGYGKIRSSYFALALLLLVLPALGRELPSPISRTLQAQILDVGQGQSVLIQTPENKRILIDGGGSWNREFDLGRYALAPVLTWNSPPKVDLVILSHSDFDHLRGLYYILKKFQVKKFLYNGYWPKGWDGQMLKKILLKENIPCSVISAGQRLTLGPKIKLEVLSPKQNCTYEKKNNRSLVLQLVYKDKALLNIPGDIEFRAIQDLCLNQDLKTAKVLILPHHGSDSSLSRKFYQMVNPELAVASCGYLNYFGFPDKKVRKALAKEEIPLISTADYGAVKLVWDLKTLELSLNTVLKK